LAALPDGGERVEPVLEELGMGGERIDGLAQPRSDLAEDAAQQAALDMWRDLPRLRDASRFEAWSYRILVRACYAEARRSRRWRIGVLSTREPLARDEYRPVVDRDELEHAFSRLSDEQRAVVVLRHYIGMPLDAIAEALGIPEGTVSSRLHRAMESLRAAIEADSRLGEPLVLPQEVTS
jgi:RNA polymerase sigma factor (sigma-70 family)